MPSVLYIFTVKGNTKCSYCNLNRFSMDALLCLDGNFKSLEPAQIWFKHLL